MPLDRVSMNIYTLKQETMMKGGGETSELRELNVSASGVRVV